MLLLVGCATSFFFFFSLLLSVEKKKVGSGLDTSTKEAENAGFALHVV